MPRKLLLMFLACLLTAPLCAGTDYTASYLRRLQGVWIASEVWTAEGSGARVPQTSELLGKSLVFDRVFVALDGKTVYPVDFMPDKVPTSSIPSKILEEYFPKVDGGSIPFVSVEKNGKMIGAPGDQLFALEGDRALVAWKDAYILVIRVAKK